MYHVRHAHRIRHTQTPTCLSVQWSGLGMENAHDSVEKPSADLWEIKGPLWLVGRPFGSLA